MDGPEPKLVRYYLDGWRTGFLLETNGYQSVIRPISPKGAIRRTVTVPSDDVKEVNNE